MKCRRFLDHGWASYGRGRPPSPNGRDSIAISTHLGRGELITCPCLLLASAATRWAEGPGRAGAGARWRRARCWMGFACCRSGGPDSYLPAFLTDLENELDTTTTTTAPPRCALRREDAAPSSCHQGGRRTSGTPGVHGRVFDLVLQRTVLVSSCWRFVHFSFCAI